MQNVRQDHLRRIAAGFIAAAMVGWPVIAQSAASAPDLSGHWGRTNFNLEEPASGPGPTVNTMRKQDGTIDDDLARVGNYTNPILRPEAAAVLKQRGEYSQTGLSIPDMHNQCWSEPPPFTLTIELEMRMLQTKDEVVIVYVNGQSTRHIRLNAQHPANLKPSWLGDSIGHYEGDTLVVDTVGIKTGPFSTLDRYGTPFSEKIHVVERYRLIDGKAAAEAVRKHRLSFTKANALPRFDGYGAEIDQAPAKGLQVEVTVDDPGTFTKPWSGLVTYLPESGWPEMICAENTLELTGPPRKVPVADKPDF